MSRRDLLLTFVVGTMLLASVTGAAPGGVTHGRAAPAVSHRPGAGPVEIALRYAAERAEDLGVRSSDVADLVVASSYRSAHSGVTHVNLNQRHDGREVFGAYATVNVAADGTVVFVGDSLVKGLGAGASGAQDVDATEAVTAAADALDLDRPRNLRVLSQGGGPARKAVVSRGGISDQPIPARLGWQPTKSGLRLAWQLTIDDSSAEHLWNATVDAASGELLAVEDWTSRDSLGDLGNLMRSGAASTDLPAVASGPLPPDPVDDGSSYRVFELPKESPNDGPRTLVENPADATASPFGWHDTDGAPGAEFTIARGNNVHAYLDQDNSNSADFGDTDGGAGVTFDFPADLDEHAQNYRDAVVTNLFYMNNVFHDVMWRYGFDEAAGNFQANNLGRGGTAGDYVRAEAADGGGTNNANFSTPIETPTSGGTPRMQMYLWPGNQFGAQNQVVAHGVGSFDASWSRFGPAPTPGGASGTLVYAGTGCTADLYPAELPTTAWIAVVDGGTAACSYLQRVETAESLGADGVVVAHNTSRSPPVLTASMTAPPVGIPAVAVSQADGNTIKAAIAAGTTTGSVRKHPEHPGIRDGDFENGIIIHEYGHGVSNRLTGGPTINCLVGSEQMGEGWSDYLAITLLLDPALDDPDEPRGMGPYALFQDDRHGAGIRPRPYSRDMAIQPFTYDSIKTGGWLNGTSLAIPHGLGHGWAAVLWDLNWDLIDKHGFNPNVYEPWNTGGNNRALQYVIDGLKFQGCGPGFVVARDAIIAVADLLSEGEDTCTVWATFARRGLGFSAVQGNLTRDDNTEAFDTHPDCREGFFGGVSDPPTINAVTRGATVPLVFSVGGNQGLDILVKNSPYSRQVNCTTLRTEEPGAEFITPRPLPVATEAEGQGLTYDAREDRYSYRWRTLAEWAGTCREVVVTRKDGIQHRAFFRFDSTPSHPVSGHVRDADNQPLANATVTIEGASVSPATTDVDGFYLFESVPNGTYSATASAGGCNAPQTRELVVFRPTTLDFTLPRCTTQRVSVASDGAEGNDDSFLPSVSADGRYVAFYSFASSLVPGDGNGTTDVFVHDRDSETTERVSVASDGAEGNGFSSLPSTSGDGRQVAFESFASNLVPGDTNGTTDIFVHDRDSGTTERVSVASNGAEGNRGSSLGLSISADGRYVAFCSLASNLVPGDTNGTYDVFVHDRDSGTTERVSVASDGSEGNGACSAPSISADGRYVAFPSFASNLVSGDSNGAQDVFVHDRDSGITERVSVASDGAEGKGHASTPSVSADGRYVAFPSAASNLVSGDSNGAADAFVHDRASGTTERVSVASDGAEGNGHSPTTSLSADGRYVAFYSVATNLVPGDSNGAADAFVHDRHSGTTERVSVASDGAEGNGDSFPASVSADGRFVAFDSNASNLVFRDTNGVSDVFVRDRSAPGARALTPQGPSSEVRGKP